MSQLSTEEQEISDWADRLYEAGTSKQPIRPLTEVEPNFTIESAYKVQLKNTARRVAHGDVVVGHKIGLTSKPMQKLLGVSEPDYGHLFRSMQFYSGNVIDFPLVQPKIEPEIAFILKEDLVGPNVTILDVIHAIDFVVPAIEVIDSRIADWKIKLPDTIADNASSGCYVLGTRPFKISEIDIARIGMVMSVDGSMVDTGSSAAVLGNPLLAVAWLANKLFDFDTTLRARHVVLSGAVCSAVSLQSGQRFQARFGQFGSVEGQFQ